MGTWIDLNKDGRKDFLIARTNGKAGGGELVWYEHPEGGLDTTPWNEHVITTGPDVGTEVHTFNQFRDEIVVFASEFFDEKVAFYRVSLKDGSLVDSRIIDDTTILNAYMA